LQVALEVVHRAPVLGERRAQVDLGELLLQPRVGEGERGRL
jgi:hypothetical protein